MFEIRTVFIHCTRRLKISRMLNPCYLQSPSKWKFTSLPWGERDEIDMIPSTWSIRITKKNKLNHLYLLKLSVLR